MDIQQNNIVVMSHWVSVGQYAHASGIQKRAVHDRIRRGVICSIKVDDLLVIDTNVSVPSKRLVKASDKPTFKWPPQLPASHRLVQLSQFCNRNGIRGHDLYHDIFLGKWKVYCFAKTVFIEEVDELQNYVKHRRKSWQIR